jgi:hypothetical protein
MQDLLLNSDGNSYGWIFGTGLTVDKGFLSLTLIGPFPTVKYFPGNPKKSAGLRNIAVLFRIIEDS